MSNPDSPGPANFDPDALIRKAKEALDKKAVPPTEAEDSRQDEARGRARRRLDELLSMTVALNSRERVDEVLDQILQSALEITRGDRAYVLQKKGGDLRALASHSRDDAPVEPEGYRRISHTILDRVLSAGETYHASDADENALLLQTTSVRDLSLRTVVCVPLKTDKEVIGAIYVDSQSSRGILVAEDVELLERLGDQGAVALGRVQREEQLTITAESLEAENVSLRVALEERSKFDRIKGSSRAMRAVYSVLERVAKNDVTVLVTGETGTGKELVARALHFNGKRKAGNFVAVNCAAFSESLLESELFGFRKGSFTGADHDRPGLVETASGGTLFLDEIAEMGPDLQSKLLRVIEEREVRRLGENMPRKVDIRLVAATHRNLAEWVAQGKFREDLYYRINVVSLELPPLREREEDVLLLAEHFLEEQRQMMERPGLRLSREARPVLLRHPWPGNVRELRNLIERACALTDRDELSPQDLGVENEVGEVRRSIPGGTLRETLLEAERQAIEGALESNHGVVKRAAESLDVTRQHLHNRIRKLGIDPQEFRN